jgi:hypothetical protein
VKTVRNWIVGLGLVVCLTACKSTHSFVARVEGATGCIPDISITTITDGKVDGSDLSLVLLPWVKEFPNDLDELHVDVRNHGGATGAGLCPQIQCQLIVDGKPAVVRADGALVECKWAR